MLSFGRGKGEERKIERQRERHRETEMKKQNGGAVRLDLPSDKRCVTAVTRSMVECSFSHKAKQGVLFSPFKVSETMGSIGL